MAEQYRAKRTSEEISRWDAANYPGGFNRYAEELRNAIERELREWGECPLLERLDRERPYISAPLFEVLRSVHQRQKNEAAPAASKATQSLPRSPAPFHATHAPALLCGGAFLFPGGVV